MVFHVILATFRNDTPCEHGYKYYHPTLCLVHPSVDY